MVSHHGQNLDGGISVICLFKVIFFFLFFGNCIWKITQRTLKEIVNSGCDFCSFLEIFSIYLVYRVTISFILVSAKFVTINQSLVSQSTKQQETHLHICHHLQTICICLKLGALTKAAPVPQNTTSQNTLCRLCFWRR